MTIPRPRRAVAIKCQCFYIFAKFMAVEFMALDFVAMDFNEVFIRRCSVQAYN